MFRAALKEAFKEAFKEAKFLHQNQAQFFPTKNKFQGRACFSDQTDLGQGRGIYNEPTCCSLELFLFPAAEYVAAAVTRASTQRAVKVEGVQSLSEVPFQPTFLPAEQPTGL